MSVSGISSGGASSPAATQSSRDVQRVISVMRMARRQETEQAAQLVELIAQAGRQPDVGQHISVYA
ncbi:MAG TPA: hypothetical protein VGK32_05160 [Vicinamibacterales bacterium]|jgi:hypothetical protein